MSSFLSCWSLCRDSDNLPSSPPSSCSSSPSSPDWDDSSLFLFCCCLCLDRETFSSPLSSCFSSPLSSNWEDSSRFVPNSSRFAEADTLPSSPAFASAGFLFCTEDSGVCSSWVHSPDPEEMASSSSSSLGSFSAAVFTGFAGIAVGASVCWAVDVVNFGGRPRRPFGFCCFFFFTSATRVSFDSHSPSLLSSPYK